MPTYSYKCTSCDNAFDIVQSFTDDSLTTCEVCGSPLRKVFSPVGVTFNGSGFYRTDSRASGKSGGSGSGGSSSSSGSGSSASGTSGSGGSSSSSDGGSSGSSSSSSSAPASKPATSGGSAA